MKLIKFRQNKLWRTKLPAAMEDQGSVIHTTVLDDATFDTELHDNCAKILTAQANKREERGGFSADAYVTVAEHPAGSFGYKYCIAQPEKYPEIIEENEIS